MLWTIGQSFVGLTGTGGTNWVYVEVGWLIVWGWDIVASSDELSSCVILSFRGGAGGASVESLL